MALDFIPLLLPLIGAALVNLVLARYVWLRRKSPGALALAMLMVGLAGWSITYACVIAGADLATKVLWFRLEYFPIALAVFAWTLFVIQYAGWSGVLRPAFVGLLLAEPIVTVVLIWTNDAHHLMFLTMGTHQAAGYQALDLTFGSWYWVNLAYQYLTYLGGSIALAAALAHRRRLYRMQAVSLLLGAVVPIAGSIIHKTGLVPLDIAPFALSVSGAIWWWGLVRYRVLDVAPVATPVALESIFAGMVDAVVVVDAGGGIVKLNPAAALMLGDRSPHTLVGLLLDRLPVEVVADPEQYARAEITLDVGKEPREFDLRVSPLRHRGGAIAGRILALRDVTDRKRAEEALEHQARHDSLTGLPNRTLLRDSLERACQMAVRDGSPVALLFLDLDNFKTVNDSLGHAAGDDLLVAVAARLLGCLRPGDLAARLGGDEFAVVLTGSADARSVREFATRLTEALRQPFTLGTAEIVLGASTGIALAGPEALGPDDMLRNADAAMYSAKALGKGRFAFFALEMHQAAQARMLLEADLRRALVHHEFEVYYQPVVDLHSGALSGSEALVRWNHPERGMVMPLEFIPLCEEVGLIVPLGEWVLREACLALRTWQERCVGRTPPMVSVNLSPRQLQQPDLVESVARILRETGASPGALVLEITESALLDDSEATLATLTGLFNLGLRLAIDDFGTGYSALSYLQRFPISVLKIDRSFVQGMERSGERSALVRAILALGQALGLNVVAEGIETTGQREQLQALGCDLGQGYLFARPGSRQAFDDLLDLEKLGQLPWTAPAAEPKRLPRAA
jgi:diguanylate cyclase (GGDEF)-like protein